MEAPSDVRLIETPMQSLACGECTARVLVRKSTWQQTSIQWTAEALNACRERAAFSDAEDSAEPFRGCESLNETIREAASEGTITIIHRDAPQE